MNHPRRTPSLLTRLVAGAGIAIVLLLNVLASSPEAHAWIHHYCGCGAEVTNASNPVGRLLNVLGANPEARAWIQNHHGTNAGGTHNHNGANPDDDGCVVTLFAHGVVTATVFAALVIALFRLLAVVSRPREVLYLSAPHYLLPPLCGPPQG